MSAIRSQPTEIAQQTLSEAFIEHVLPDRAKVRRFRERFGCMPSDLPRERRHEAWKFVEELLGRSIPLPQPQALGPTTATEALSEPGTEAQSQESDAARARRTYNEVRSKTAPLAERLVKALGEEDARSKAEALLKQYESTNGKLNGVPRARLAPFISALEASVTEAEGRHSSQPEPGAHQDAKAVTPEKVARGLSRSIPDPVAAKTDEGDEDDGPTATEESDPTPAEYARTLDRWGVHVLPLERNEKKPIGGRWQERSRDENLSLFDKHPAAGVGFIPGRTVDPITDQPAPLVHADVDGPDAWHWFQEQVPAEVWNKTIAWRTARGGYGFVFRLPPGSPLADTGWTKRNIWSQKSSKHPDRKQEAIELRARGCQGVLPPTQVTIAGTPRQYTWLAEAKRFEDFAGPTELPLLPDVLHAKGVAGGVSNDPKPEPTPPAEELSPEYFDAVRTVAECVEALPPESVDGYEDALELGMAIHSALPDAQGFQFWNSLCKKALDVYNDDPTWTAKKWKTFHQKGNDEGQITLGTLVGRARPYLGPRAEDEFTVYDTQTANKGDGEGSERAQGSRQKRPDLLLDEGPVANLFRSIGLDHLANPDRQHEVLRAFADGFHGLPLEVQPAAEAAMLRLLRQHVPHTRAEALLRYAIAPSAVEPPYEITGEGQAVYRTLDVRRYDLDAQYVIDGVLPSGNVAMISADMSTGKSWLALQMALSVGFGKPLLGNEVSNASPVVYLATEGASSLMLRCSGWLIKHELLNEQHTLADLYDVLEGKLHVVPDPLPFDHPHFEATFRGTVKTMGAPLVICDTLGKMLGREQNENDSNAANAVTGMLSRLCHETGTTVLLLHHTGYKNADRARGSSGWEQGCDLTFSIMGTREDLKNERPLTLVERKPWRGGALDLRLPFKLTTSEVYLLNPDAEPVELDKSNPMAVINHPGQYMTGRLEPPTSGDFGHLGIELKSLVTVRSGCKVQVLHFALQVMAELHESRSKAGDEEGVSRTDFTAAYNERVEEAAVEQDYQGKALKLDKNGAVALIGRLCGAGLLAKEGSGTKTRYRVTSAGLECAIKTAEQFAGLWEPPE